MLFPKHILQCKLQGVIIAAPETAVESALADDAKSYDRTIRDICSPTQAGGSLRELISLSKFVMRIARRWIFVREIAFLTRSFKEYMNLKISK